MILITLYALIKSEKLEWNDDHMVNTLAKSFSKYQGDHRSFGLARLPIHVDCWTEFSRTPAELRCGYTTPIGGDLSAELLPSPPRQLTGKEYM